MPVWLVRWMNKEETKIQDLALFQWVQQAEFWLVVLTMGGLAFLNTWDFPIYVGLFACVVVLKRMRRDGWSMDLFWLLMRIGVTLGVLGVGVYLPFYVGFSSQAGGFLPSLAYFTRGAHLWVMFGTLLMPIFVYLLWLWGEADGRKQLWNGLKMAGTLVGGLWLFSFLVATMMIVLPMLAPGSASLQNGAILLSNLQGVDRILDILAAFMRRLQQPGAWSTLFFLAIIIWSLVLRFSEGEKRTETRGKNVSQPNWFFIVSAILLSIVGLYLLPGLVIAFWIFWFLLFIVEKRIKTKTETKRVLQPSDGFVLVMLFLGLGLVIVPEFVYLRDQFSTRMNTIFKFYFQTWILWGAAAAYACVVLWRELKKNWKVVWGVALVALVVCGLIYPFFGVKTQTGGFRLSNLSLDGIAYYNPDELAAIHWLRQAPDGAIVEAVGGSYSGYARMATHSGLPNVLGWPGHESQWRGGAEEMGSRENDIATIYQSSRWEETQFLLSRYNVRYVVVGSLERGKYNVYDQKFEQHLTPVFVQGSTIIYEVPEYESLPVAPIQ